MAARIPGFDDHASLRAIERDHRRAIPRMPRRRPSPIIRPPDPKGANARRRPAARPEPDGLPCYWLWCCDRMVHCAPDGPPY
jgi:hypothetical protein